MYPRHMASPKTKAAPRGRPPAGHVQMLLQLRPDQRQALVDLAEKRREPGQRPPISEVVRELLDEALRRRTGSR